MRRWGAGGGLLPHIWVAGAEPWSSGGARHGVRVPIASSRYGGAAGSRTLVLRRTGTRVSAAQVAVFVDTGGSISTSCGSGVNLSARVLISWDSGAGSESFRLVNRRLEAASGAQRTTYARTSYAKRAASVGISAEALRRAAAKCL